MWKPDKVGLLLDLWLLEWFNILQGSSPLPVPTLVPSCKRFLIQYECVLKTEATVLCAEDFATRSRDFRSTKLLA